MSSYFAATSSLLWELHICQFRCNNWPPPSVRRLLLGHCGIWGISLHLLCSASLLASLPPNLSASLSTAAEEWFPFEDNLSHSSLVSCWKMSLCPSAPSVLAQSWHPLARILHCYYHREVQSCYPRAQILRHYYHREVELGEVFLTWLIWSVGNNRSIPLFGDEGSAITVNDVSSLLRQQGWSPLIRVWQWRNNGSVRP